MYNRTQIAKVPRLAATPYKDHKQDSLQYFIASFAQARLSTAVVIVEVDEEKLADALLAYHNNKHPGSTLGRKGNYFITVGGNKPGQFLEVGWLQSVLKKIGGYESIPGALADSATLATTLGGAPCNDPGMEPTVRGALAELLKQGV